MSEQKDWTGKIKPTIEKRRSPLSKVFETKDWTIELIPYRLADVTFHWSGVATHKTTGEEKEFGPYRTKDGDAYRAIVEFSAGAFGTLREVKAGDSEREEQDRQMLQAALDSGEPLTVSMRNRIAQLGLTKTPEPGAAPANAGLFTPDEDAIFTVWCHREPQKEFFLVTVGEQDPHRHGQIQRQQHNFQAVSDYLRQHTELRPVTLETLNRAYAVLLSMDCVHKSHTFHRGYGTAIQGRAYDYSSDRDPSFKRQRTYTEAEILAASQPLLNVRVTPDVVIAKLGDTPLAHAVVEYWQERSGR